MYVLYVLIPMIQCREECSKRWEEKWSRKYPGRSWGIDSNCLKTKRRKIAYHGREEWIHMKSGKGIEIGACDMPIQFEHLEMDYLDKSKEDVVLCFGSKNKRVTIVDDASTLGSIPSNSYDLVVAAHVLEHQDNVIQTLLAWLRVSRSLVYFIVPDICEMRSGDQYRLITKPTHFFEEFFQNNSKQNYQQHLQEAAIGAAYFNFSGHALPFAIDGCLDAQPKLLDNIVQNNLARYPLAAHLHTFTFFSLHQLLHRLQQFSPTFDILRIDIVQGDNIFLHDEIRVLLRKKFLFHHHSSAKLRDFFLKKTQHLHTVERKTPRS
uniref:Methyltransferase type 11 domain-containing protein n=1 Tax=Aureoumbra lagunensis TaxID=44058 RepID=A0A7S3K6S9_9STRA